MSKNNPALQILFCLLVVIACIGYSHHLKTADAQTHPANAEDFSLISSGNVSHFPAALLEIGEEAFEGASLSAVILPEGLVSIGSRAFADNESLQTIVIQDSLQILESDAFSGSSSLTIIGDPGSVAEDWAREEGIPFIYRKLFFPAMSSDGTWKIVISLFFVSPVPDELREGIQKKLRNLRSLRRKDRPEMDVPEAAVP